MIEKIELYETMGQQFTTYDKAVNYRESLVEKFLRSCPGFQDIPAKQRIAFVSHILDNREALRHLLDYNSKDTTSDHI